MEPRMKSYRELYHEADRRAKALEGDAATFQMQAVKEQERASKLELALREVLRRGPLHPSDLGCLCHSCYGYRKAKEALQE